MDDADERNKDNKKGGFTWIEKISYAGLSDEELDLTDDEPAEYDDRFDPSSQACQTVDQVGVCWADYAGSMESYEPQREISEPAESYEPQREIYESLKHDVDRLVTSNEQKSKEIEQQSKVIERVLVVSENIFKISKYVVVTISWIVTFMVFYRFVFLPTMEAESAALFSFIISAIIGYLMGFPGYKWLLEKLLSFKPPSPPSSD